MNTIANDVFRKRLLIEGYYTINIDESILVAYFAYITDELNLRTYGDPIVHTTGGQGKKKTRDMMHLFR